LDVDPDVVDPGTPLSSNQTNLAIKGIIGVAAMSKMSLAAGHVVDADKYSVRNNSSHIDIMHQVQPICRIQLLSSTSNGRLLHWAVTNISLLSTMAHAHGHWVTTYLQIDGWKLIL
jgi:hypothetical protein